MNVEEIKTLTTFRIWQSPFEIKHEIYREVFDYRPFFFFELTSTVSKNI
jgi:hypothetical protein